MDPDRQYRASHHSIEQTIAASAPVSERPVLDGSEARLEGAR